MEIVQPYARLCGVVNPSGLFYSEDGVALLRRIEAFGRVSHRSEDKQTCDSWRRFIETVVLGHGDWSIVEHASVSVEAVVDRGIQQEWTRHRLFAYTIESTRFVRYGAKVDLGFVLPPELDATACDTWHSVMEFVAGAYGMLLYLGVKPQIARSVLPLSFSSRMIVTGNLRNWRHFFLMRTSRQTHPQMRQVVDPLLAEFKERIPLLYDDIEPGASQAENLKKPR